MQFIQTARAEKQHVDLNYRSNDTTDDVQQKNSCQAALTSDFERGNNCSYMELPNEEKSSLSIKYHAVQEGKN